MSQSRLMAWYQASRPPFFVATMIPLALGGVIAHSDGYWNTLRWVILLFASFLVHLSTNLVNDYFDYTSGADAGDSIGGSRVIHEGKITLSEIRNAIILLYALAFVAGLWIVWDSGVWWLLAFMLFRLVPAPLAPLRPSVSVPGPRGEPRGRQHGADHGGGHHGGIGRPFRAARVLAVSAGGAHGGPDTLLPVVTRYRS